MSLHRSQYSSEEVEGLLYQMIKRDSVRVLTLCDKRIAGNPVVEYVEKEKTWSIFLLDSGGIRARVMERSNSDCNERVIF
jgi:hypothetical protein